MSLADDEPGGGGATGDDVTVDGQRRTTTTFCLADMWARWWRVLEPASDGSSGGDSSDGSATVNDTAAADEQALMHPDMAVMTVARTVNATQ